MKREIIVVMFVMFAGIAVALLPTYATVSGTVTVSELCGNGVTRTQFGEECDDGNTISGDGCDEFCQIETTTTTTTIPTTSTTVPSTTTSTTTVPTTSSTTTTILETTSTTTTIPEETTSTTTTLETTSTTTTLPETTSTTTTIEPTTTSTTTTIQEESCDVACVNQNLGYVRGICKPVPPGCTGQQFNNDIGQQTCSSTSTCCCDFG